MNLTFELSKPKILKQTKERVKILKNKRLLRRQNEMMDSDCLHSSRVIDVDIIDDNHPPPPHTHTHTYTHTHTHTHTHYPSTLIHLEVATLFSSQLCQSSLDPLPRSIFCANFRLNISIFQVTELGQSSG